VVAVFAGDAAGVVLVVLEIEKEEEGAALVAVGGAAMELRVIWRLTYESSPPVEEVFIGVGDDSAATTTTVAAARRSFRSAGLALTGGGALGRASAGTEMVLARATGAGEEAAG